VDTEGEEVGERVGNGEIELEGEVVLLPPEDVALLKGDLETGWGVQVGNKDGVEKGAEGEIKGTVGEEERVAG